MYKYIKRITDIVLSFITLLFFLPLFLLLGLLIKIDSPGSAFFIQKRSGQNGTIFNIFKFRSMKIDTPNLATDRLGDPGQYLTRIGKIIRKTSLDELPQLINILRGDMSFVGPRPALYNQYGLIESRKRLGIDRLKPGLTGYAQIMGRDFITDEQKVEYDQYYLDNVSFILDLEIMFLTFFKVVKAEGVKIDGILSGQATSGSTREM